MKSKQDGLQSSERCGRLLSQPVERLSNAKTRRVCVNLPFSPSHPATQEIWQSNRGLAWNGQIGAKRADKQAISTRTRRTMVDSITMTVFLFRVFRKSATRAESALWFLLNETDDYFYEFTLSTRKSSASSRFSDQGYVQCFPFFVIWHVVPFRRDDYRRCVVDVEVLWEAGRLNEMKNRRRRPRDFFSLSTGKERLSPSFLVGMNNLGFSSL